LSFPQGYDDPELSVIIAGWASETNLTVQEPVFEYDPKTNKVTAFTPPRNGQELDQAKTKADLLSLLDKIRSGSDTDIELVLELQLTTTQPQTSLASLNDIGLTEVIGVGTSTYRGSIPNRIYNVQHTATKINNTLVPPGATFSFNKTLGEVSARTGFRSAYVIKNGRTELGDGGGVCQVSTTLFRATLDAGLKIDKRLQHSYRVGYYEQGFKPGLDATVYAGDIDFRFTNDTDHYILIHSEIDPQKLALTTTIYGTSDGRQTKIVSHEVWDARSAPPAEYYSDPSLAPGQVVQVDWAVGGIKSRVVNEVRDASGKLIRTDEYYSNYKPWSAKYLVGQ